MDGEEIRSLRASVAAPREMPMPVPPSIPAFPAAPLRHAGADPAEVEASVRVVLGRPERVPPMSAPPDAAERELMFCIVPDP